MADFIEDEDVKEIADNLIEVWNDKLSYIDTSRMKFAREISSSQRTQTGACLPVYPPHNLLNPDILYIIAIYYKSDWDNLTDAQKHALVMHQLLHIKDDFSGALAPHDVQDFCELVDSFGSDYLENASLPDIMERDDATDTVAAEGLEVEASV